MGSDYKFWSIKHGFFAVVASQDLFRRKLYWVLSSLFLQDELWMSLEGNVLAQSSHVMYSSMLELAEIGWLCDTSCVCCSMDWLTARLWLITTTMMQPAWPMQPNTPVGSTTEDVGNKAPAQHQEQREGADRFQSHIWQQSWWCESFCCTRPSNVSQPPNVFPTKTCYWSELNYLSGPHMPCFYVTSGCLVSQFYGRYVPPFVDLVRKTVIHREPLRWISLVLQSPRPPNRLIVSS